MRQRMRIFAIINLLYLTLLTASTVSAVHVDHDGSHETVCTNEINARCHAELPHAHDEAHGGEESLFEHTFENGIRKNSAPILIISLPVSIAVVTPITAGPEIIVAAYALRDFHDDDPLSLFFVPASPRAPPVA